MTNESGRPEIVKDLTITSRERPLGDMMREAQRALVVHLEHALRAAGYDDVGAAHASVLANVDVDGTRLATLRERGGRTKQATAELAGLLVDRGYLTLGPDPTDRRAKLYVPTADGRRLLGACRIVVDAYEKWLDGVLGRDGVAALRRSLDEIARRGPEQPTIGAAWRRGGRPRTGSRTRLSGTR
jgi:DNA-binding MarR family transcriptional regulator